MIVLLLTGILAAEGEAPLKQRLKSHMVRGQRFTGQNIVSYKIATTIRKGKTVTTSTEFVERNERFVDTIRRAGENGVLEIERNYTKLFTKVRVSKNERPKIYKSPLTGRTVTIRESGRRREVKLKGHGQVDSLARRTAGMEIDWRDIFPRDPVGPGDVWDADASALAHRLAAYLNCGNRSKMRVRYEEIQKTEQTSIAKLYVDWTIEGMRDRNLYTKVNIAGDVYFDLTLRRVVKVDMIGSMIVRGAIIGEGHPRIIKGEGPVVLKSSLKVSPAPVEASAPPK